MLFHETFSKFIVNEEKKNYTHKHGQTRVHVMPTFFLEMVSDSM